MRILNKSLITRLSAILAAGALLAPITATAASAAQQPADAASATPANLIVNGSFEQADVALNTWAAVTTLEGWHLRTGFTEVWGNGLNGQYASDGERFLELDLDELVNGGDGPAVEGIEQTVATVPGDTYELTFDIKKRNGGPARTNVIEVEVDGASIGTWKPRTTSWTTVTASFVADDDGQSIVGFSEAGSVDDSYGSHLDNVRLTRTITPVTPPSGELKITEVMQNPSLSNDAAGEWFEVYNPSGQGIDINGWTISDIGHDTHVIDNGGPLVVPAGGYLVLGNNADRVTNGGVSLDYSYGHHIFLFNSDDELVLETAAGTTVASLTWDDGATMPDPTGASMALRSVDSDMANPANWCVSTKEFGAGDLGTPGAPNVCDVPESVVITEIMQNPDAASDVIGEWFEVANTGSTPVDLAGWTIHDDDGDRHVINSSVAIAPGARAVLARNADETVNGGAVAAYGYGEDIRLFNSWDELVLVNPQGLRVDRVKWDDGRSFPDPTGASMSVIDPAADNSVGSAWCTATSTFGMGDRGTPGAVNNCAPAIDYAGPGVFITEIMRNPAASSDGYGEWFEVFNPNGSDVDLNGWIIRDKDTNYHVINGSVVVPANGYAVLGRSATLNGGVAINYDYANVVLHNGSDELVLAAPSGSIVDQVVWNDSEFPAEPGFAMSLVSLGANNSVGENWCPSAPVFGDGDHGTPGAANVCVADSTDSTLLISEIMVNPAQSYDSVGEWFEVHNYGAADIDLNGYVVKDEDFNEFTIPSSVIVPAGGYAVIGRETDVAINGGATLAWDFNDNMVMQNSGDELVLLDTRRALVDRVIWGSGTDFTIPNGSSLQVINTTVTDASANDAAASWCVALLPMLGGDAGTPGRANTCDAPAPTEPEYDPIDDDHRCKIRHASAIVGTPGDDVIEGTPGNDIIISLGGNDTIRGLGGNDIICSGPGNDTIDAGAGNDLVIAGSGSDSITAGSGNDLVAAGPDDDKVAGGDGNDAILLDSGNDYAEGGSGNDSISGGQGTDRIDGQDGRDRCEAETELNCER